MMEEDQFSRKEIEAIRFIRNWLMHRSRSPSIRILMKELKYKSPRSVQDILEKLSVKNIIEKFEDGTYQLLVDPEFGATHAQTIDVPVVGSVACGSPVLAEENIEAFMRISTEIARPGAKHFLLHAKGDSMDEAGINDGDLVLVRQQPTANDGDNVVALIDDKATIKEFHKAKDMIILKPKSSNKELKPIILTENFQVQGLVIATIPKI